MGILEFSQGDHVVAQVNLVALEDLEAPNVFQRAGTAFDRLVGKITNVAPSMPITCYNIIETSDSTNQAA